MPSTPTLTLGAIENVDDLKACQPYLMPFHIDYSGPAPISTYLRVNAAKETVGAPAPSEDGRNDAQSASNSQEAGTSQGLVASVDATEDKMETDATHALAPDASSSSLAKHVTDATMRLISSFRGRTIQGLKVDLPEGYMGVVLHGDASDSKVRNRKGKGAENKSLDSKNTGKRVTRSRNKAKVESDEPELVDDDPMNVDEDEETRTLSVASKFSSFVLWNADHPVDEGRDEYFRSLTEWTKLAHLIHEVEE
ncbi:hypothetical protein H2248_011039 [Termitomyces sp. 'cryptogamus']|nr:hypothetical protein H2248_011039 [Termitomyces sp. 'cryptogamus']